MNRKLIVIIGAMRSGKSYYSNKLIKQYNSSGQSALVYNLGKPLDFSNAVPAFLFTKKDHLKKFGKEFNNNPEFYGLTDEKGKEIQIQDFNKEYYKGAIKCPRIDSQAERLFFDSFFDYVSNTLLVVDDARALFRYGLKAEFLQLFSRINHSGIKHSNKEWRAAGADIVLIFHSIDHVNPEIWDYCTHLINFKYAMAPDFKKIENRQIREQVIKAFKALSIAPQYSHTITDINFLKTYFYKP